MYRHHMFPRLFSGILMIALLFLGGSMIFRAGWMQGFSIGQVGIADGTAAVQPFARSAPVIPDFVWYGLLAFLGLVFIGSIVKFILRVRWFKKFAKSDKFPGKQDWAFAGGPCGPMPHHFAGRRFHRFHRHPNWGAWADEGQPAPGAEQQPESESGESEE